MGIFSQSRRPRTVDLLGLVPAAGFAEHEAQPVDTSGHSQAIVDGGGILGDEHRPGAITC